MEFSKWVAATGESKTAIAERLGVSRAFVSQLTTGKRTPSLSMALTIRDMTGGKVKPEDWRANGHG